MQFEEFGNSTIVHVCGDVDTRASTDFPRLLAQAAIEKRRVVLAFERCGSIDARAMSAIDACRRLLGDELRIVVPARSRLRTLFRNERRDEYDHLATNVKKACVQGSV